MPNSSFTGADAIKKKSDLWWQADGPFWPLHKMNNWRLGYIIEHICANCGENDAQNIQSTTPLAGLKILDVGCGGGLLSEALHQKGATVVGIDPIENNINVAQHHAAQMGVTIDYRVATAAQLAKQQETFDITIGMEVIEHIANQQQFVSHMASMTKPQGLVFLSTINRTVPALLFAKFAAEYILKILPKGTHKWREFVKPSEMQNYLHHASCSPLHTQGVRLNPFKRQFSYTQRTPMNYMMVAQKKATPR